MTNNTVRVPLYRRIRKGPIRSNDQYIARTAQEIEAYAAAVIERRRRRAEERAALERETQRRQRTIDSLRDGRPA
jgi:hypothetical protein